MLKRFLYPRIRQIHALAILPLLLLTVHASCAASTTPASDSPETTTNDLRIHFRSAPLELVLNRLAAAAGYRLEWEATPKGVADVWSAQNLTRDEALTLLHSTLAKNGLAALTTGTVLTIIDRDGANTRELPVKYGSDPRNIPSNAQLVTQIIPVRNTEVSQVIKDLQPLVSTRSIITANESANSLIITDTQDHIHKVAEVVRAIDAGAEDVTLLRVFQLQNSSPVEMVDLLTELFPDQTSSQGQTSQQSGGGPGGFGGPGGGFGGPPGMGGGFPGQNSSSSQSTGSQRLKKGARVTVVADERTGSIVVSAPKLLMMQVEQIVTDLDGDRARRQKVTVFKLRNAGAQSVASILKEAFQSTSSTSQRNNSTQTDALTTRASSSSQSTSSSRQSSQGGSSQGGGGGQIGGGTGGGGM